MSADNQTTTLGPHIDRYFGRVLGDNRPMYWLICLSTYLGRYIGRVLVDKAKRTNLSEVTTHHDRWQLCHAIHDLISERTQHIL